MKKNPNNKYLLLILAVALVITLATTVINLDRLGYLSGSDFITASATSSSDGVSNLTINSATSITNNLASINFGAGTVNGSCSVCSMGTVFGKTNKCCLSFNNISYGGFILENTGNENISVGYTCGGNGNSCNSSSFVGTATGNNFTYYVVDAFNDPVPTTDANFTGQKDTVKSCDGLGFDGWLARANQSNTSGSPTLPVATALEPVSVKGGWLCGNSTVFPLSGDNTMDSGVFHINLSISSTQLGTGARRNVTFTFNATSAG